MRTLLRGGTIHTPAGPAPAMAVDDGRIAWVGDGDGTGAWDAADEVVDLEGRLVTPAFVDAHVHVVQTGDQLAGLDLTPARSLADCLDRVAAHVSGARPPA